MNGAHMRPWHWMSMAQNQVFGTESVKQKQKNSEEHTEINMNKHYTKTYHAWLR